MIVASTKARLIWYLLVALIVGFFSIPVITFCFFDYKFFVPKKVASLLLFFFR